MSARYPTCHCGGALIPTTAGTVLCCWCLEDTCARPVDVLYAAREAHADAGCAPIQPRATPRRPQDLSNREVRALLSAARGRAHALVDESARALHLLGLLDSARELTPAGAALARLCMQAQATLFDMQAQATLFDVGPPDPAVLRQREDQAAIGAAARKRAAAKRKVP
jgi:hypothetical protein